MGDVSLASVIGIGGPVGIITLILGFMLKSYLTKRQEDRADEKTERESESGIVETTSKALQIVRAQMAEFGEDLRRKDMRIRECVEDLRGKDIRIRELEDRVSELEMENRALRFGGN